MNRRAQGIKRRTVLGLLPAISVGGCAGPRGGRLAITSVQTFPATGLQWKNITFKFDIHNATGNPFDPDDIDVKLELFDELGHRFSQPCFVSDAHEIVVDHNHEFVRNAGRRHWEARWTPRASGTYQWRLVAVSSGQSATVEGKFHCIESAGTGFVRVCETDPRCFETSDGAFFYPVGHGTRSPNDDRWRRPEDLPSGAETHKTLVYETWFRKMSQNGENCCALWMTPWWLGLEWSKSRPGYEGIGRYNQIHAAQLDRIFELAEQHDINIILYTMNHGQLSTWVDSEWYESPYYQLETDRAVNTPTDFFHSSECERLNRNKLRYIVARWGHSTRLLALVLCTEVEWIDPYSGVMANKDAPVVDGLAQDKELIDQDKQIVQTWFATMANYVRSIDAHDHLVSIQFPRLSSGNECWTNPAFDFVLNNAYNAEIRSREVTKQLGRRATGVADGVFGVAKHFSFITDKPVLIAEWGGDHIENSANELRLQHHAGIWAIALSDYAGVTGFWWWNAIDELGLYEQYQNLSLFLAGVDRRGSDLRSHLDLIKIPVSGDSDAFEFVSHPLRQSIALANRDHLFAYIFHTGIDDVDSFGSASREHAIPLEPYAFLKLPDSLLPGEYRVEFWSPQRGRIVAERTYKLESGGAESLVRLEPFRLEIAVKMQRIS